MAYNHKSISDTIHDVVEEMKAQEQFRRDVELARLSSRYDFNPEPAFNAAMNVAGYKKVMVRGPIGMETEVELSPSMQYSLGIPGGLQRYMESTGLRWAWKKK
ncbi:hypothetical protein KY343_00935 [Candidatus Woesearchaeota archaeon]|nr:hypothetical protein [Candidatus Woesearchaeota archaeon]